MQCTLHEHGAWRLSCPVSIIDRVPTFFRLFFSFLFLWLNRQTRDSKLQAGRKLMADDLGETGP